MSVSLAKHPILTPVSLVKHDDLSNSVPLTLDLADLDLAGFSKRPVRLADLVATRP